MTAAVADGTNPAMLAHQAPARPRLLGAMTGADLAAHRAARGPLPSMDAARLLDLVEESGLTGRGGAAFPTHRKLRAVARGSRPVVIANGAEGEPASGKDRVLLVHAPHLVLDGIEVACRAVGATSAHLYVPREPHVTAPVERALAQRRRERGGADDIGMVTAPPRFISGQETAAVAAVAVGAAVPRLPDPPVYERGLGRRATLVQNVETLAHLALLVRYGAPWFRAVGTPTEPGSALFTLGGAIAHPGVVEAALGTPLGVLMNSAGGPTETLSAVLVGGYHGAWVPASQAVDLSMADAVLRPLGAAVGAGVVCALPASSCGVHETARVVAYLASESAGQCGPCVNGLPAIAGGLAELAGARPRAQTRMRVERWASMVVGRGACAHPDGTVRLVRSALEVFGPEIDLHARGLCSASSRTPVLPVPRSGRDMGWR